MNENKTKLAFTTNPPLIRDFESELLQIIQGENNAQALCALLQNYHESDIALVLPKLDKNHRLKLYGALDIPLLAEIFAQLNNPELFAVELSTTQLASLTSHMPSGSASDLLERLTEQKRQNVLQLMDAKAVKDVKLIDTFDQSQIGSLITNDFVFVSISLSIKECMKKVVRDAGEKSNISTIFAVDDKGKYVGAFYLRDLVIARSDSPLTSIVMNSFPYLYAEDKIDDRMQSIMDYSEAILPVISADNRLIGALTSEDALELLDSDHTEDYAKLAALPEEALEQDVQKKGVLLSALWRLPWLLILLLLSLFIGSYIGIFESVIVALPILVNFQQLISGMSGNAGTQTLAVTIKALSDNQLSTKQKALFVFKEVRIGFLIGLVTGLISAIAVGIYAYFTANYAGLETAIKIGGALGVAMLTTSTTATLTGCLIPLTLDKLRIDPAAASGPLITTLNDFIAITVYYGIALLMLV